MKHNIAFLLPLFFFPPSHRTPSHNTCTRGGERINIIQRALQSQTPCNLSALDFKVWVFAYFVLDCCHFVILVPFFFASPRRPYKSLEKGFESGCVPFPAQDESAHWKEKKKVHLRSRPVIHLITVSVSGSFEQPSVANLPLITLANYQPQTPDKKKKKKKKIQPLSIFPRVTISICRQITPITRRRLSQPLSQLSMHIHSI